MMREERTTKSVGLLWTAACTHFYFGAQGFDYANQKKQPSTANAAAARFRTKVRAEA